MNKFTVRAVFKTNDADAAVSRISDAIKVVVARTKGQTLIESSGVKTAIRKGQIVVTLDAVTICDDIHVKEVKQHVEAVLHQVKCLPEDMNPAREDVMVVFTGATAKAC